MGRFPNLTDVEFYRSKQTLPSWATGILQAKAYGHKWLTAEVNLIDLVVNSHAGIRLTRGELGATNGVSLIRSCRRRRGDLEGLMRDMINNEGGNNRERAVHAARWMKRLKKEQG